jgi:peptide/nickel transport system permease protein
MTDGALRRRKALRAMSGGMSRPVFFASAFLCVLIFFASAADILAPYDYARQDLSARLHPPLFFGGTFSHSLGTDNLGRDILSRLIYGARVSILIAFFGTFFGAMLGTCLGFLAAHFRGLCEEAVMMLVDIQAAIPTLVLALATIAFFGNSLVLFIVLVGLDGWERFARLSRGLVLSASTSGYVASMRMVGASPARIYAGQILPNIIGPLIVQATMNFPGAIMLETALSFLGLGVSPPMTSLGQMLGQGRAYLLNAWWIAVFPGTIIFVTTLAMSMVGDWLRDRLDPTLARNKF